VQLGLKDSNGTYRAVRFHVVGVITEFATAPRDSFVLANRSYVAAATGPSAVQTLLVRTSRPGPVAARIHAPAGAASGSGFACRDGGAGSEHGGRSERFPSIYPGG
jgi:putative ABC transport system permease protein